MMYSIRSIRLKWRRAGVRGSLFIYCRINTTRARYDAYAGATRPDGVRSDVDEPGACAAEVYVRSTPKNRSKANSIGFDGKRKQNYTTRAKPIT